MGFGCDNPIPAVPHRGHDQFLIIGFEGTDAYVVDQEGDIRLITFTELRTKWTYLEDLGVWHSTQKTMEEETHEEMVQLSNP